MADLSIAWFPVIHDQEKTGLQEGAANKEETNKDMPGVEIALAEGAQNAFKVRLAHQKPIEEALYLILIPTA